MYWQSLTLPGTSTFAGLALTADASTTAGLTLEAGRLSMFRLTIGNEPHLWARSLSACQGVWIVRKQRSTSLGVVPPIRASEARSIQDAESWMKHFAAALVQSDASPVRSGVWRLTELRNRPPSMGRIRWSEDVLTPVDANELPSPAYAIRTSAELPRVHYESWYFNGSGRMFLLRDLSPADAGRVKSWRKHARTGTLPPLLLWWVGAFDAYLLLDGHDRLQAALAEDATINAVALWEPFVRTFDDERHQELNGYERAFEAEERLALSTRKQLGLSLAAAFGPWRLPMTRSRARRDMDSIWREEVSEELADNADLLERVLAAKPPDV